MAGNVFNVPHSISAGSLNGLFRAFLLNNITDGVEYKYFDIQFDGKKWVAFYYKQASKPQNFEEMKEFAERSLSPKVNK